MNKDEQIQRLVDKAMNSLDDVKSASPAAYLMTRINQRLQRRTVSPWEKAGLLIGRPVIAIPALALLLLMNVLAIVNNSSESSNTMAEQQAQLSADDFTNSIATIYDNENP